MSLVTSRELFFDPALPVAVDSVTERRLIQKKLHRHEYLELLFVRRGSLANRFVSSEVVMKAGDLIILKPHVRHVLEFRDKRKPLLAFCCSFLPDIVDSGIRSLYDPDGRFLHYILRRPLGVVVGFLAWNFPLLDLGNKLGPVPASGCSAIIKPSTHTPPASLEAAHLAKEAGVPDGVINAVTCSNHDVTRALLRSEVPSLVTMISPTRGGLKHSGVGKDCSRYSIEKYLTLKRVSVLIDS